jgi:hypothetical protein
MTMFEPLSGADGARIVPASGNLGVAGKQFWLGPDSRELATRPHPIHSAPPRRPGSARPIRRAITPGPPEPRSESNAGSPATA